MKGVALEEIHIEGRVLVERVPSGTGAQDHLGAQQIVEVPADRDLRNVQVGSQLIHRDAGVAVHVFQDRRISAFDL